MILRKLKASLVDLLYARFDGVGMVMKLVDMGISTIR